MGTTQDIYNAISGKPIYNGSMIVNPGNPSLNFSGCKDVHIPYANIEIPPINDIDDKYTNRFDDTLTQELRMTWGGTWAYDVPITLNNTTVFVTGTDGTNYSFIPSNEIGIQDFLYDENNLEPGKYLTYLNLENVVNVYGNVVLRNIPYMTGLEAPKLEHIGGNCDLSIMPSLQYINISGLTTAQNLALSGLTSCVDINANSLTTVNSGISLGFMAITGISLPNLTTLRGNFIASGLTGVVAISMPNVTWIGGNFNPSGLSICTHLNLSGLQKISDNFISYMPGAMTGLYLPNLTDAFGTLNIPNSSLYVDLENLTTIRGQFLVDANTYPKTINNINLPKLSYWGNTFSCISIPNCASSVAMPNLVSGINYTTNYTYINAPVFILGTPGITKMLNVYSISTYNFLTPQKMNQWSIDRTLAVLASLNGLNGTTVYNNKLCDMQNVPPSPSFNGTTVSGLGSGFRAGGQNIVTGYITGHGLLTGDIVSITGLTGPWQAIWNRHAKITKINNDVFSFPGTGTGSGESITQWVVVRKPLCFSSTAISGQSPDNTHATIYAPSHGLTGVITQNLSYIECPSGNDIVTVTCSGHNFISGHIIAITDTLTQDPWRPHVFNGYHQITSAPTVDTFTYKDSGCAGTYATSGTITKEGAIVSILDAEPTGFNGIYVIGDVTTDTFTILNSTTGDATTQGTISKDGLRFHQIVAGYSGQPIYRKNTVSIYPYPYS